MNGTYSSELLIPPSIMGASEDVQKAIVVKEGENLRLRCGATGTPKPDIEWHRLDNRPISYGRWEGKEDAYPFVGSFAFILIHPCLIVPNTDSLFDDRTHLEHYEYPASTHGLVSVLC